MEEWLAQGVVPVMADGLKAFNEDKPFSIATNVPYLMGQCAGHVTEVKSAHAIVQDLVLGAIATIRNNQTLISNL
jgi:hypothetical protein